MWLIVGLGNPEDKYLTTRHNIGFMAVDAFVRRYNFSDWKEKFQGLYTSGSINGEKVVLLKPQTYMNLSGKSVQAAASFFKVAPENILVIHDEIDLENLKVRIKQGGSDAGHNGLRSISNLMGTPNYIRLRIGVGHPAKLGLKQSVSAYVLNNFSKSELPEFERLCEQLTEIMPQVLEGDEAGALNALALMK